MASSSRGPCNKILTIHCIGCKTVLDAHRKLLYEQFSIYVYIAGPAAAVAIMFHLICSWSIVAVACMWYMEYLPPTLFRASYRCSFDGIAKGFTMSDPEIITCGRRSNGYKRDRPDEVAEMQLLVDVFVSSKPRSLKMSKRRWNLITSTVAS